MSDVYGFDRDRAMILKGIADNPKVINRLDLKRRGLSGGAGGGGGRVVFPPSGGIPAATLNTGKTVVTMGTAECFLASVGTSGATKTYTKETEVLRVYNTVRRVVGDNGAPLQVKLTNDGLWIADVEDCDS